MNVWIILMTAKERKREHKQQRHSHTNASTKKQITFRHDNKAMAKNGNRQCELNCTACTCNWIIVKSWWNFIKMQRRFDTLGILSSAFPCAFNAFYLIAFLMQANSDAATAKSNAPNREDKRKLIIKFALWTAHHTDNLMDGKHKTEIRMRFM